MQACVTKWFKPMDPSKHAQYHEWLFEKEKMDRQKKQEERDARIKAVRPRGVGGSGFLISILGFDQKIACLD